MRMHPPRILVAGALALGLATPLQAQTTEWFRLTSAGNVVANGVYVGPYVGQELGSQPGGSGPTIDMYCVDFLHEATLNVAWQAFVTPLTALVSGASRGGSAAVQAYQEAAWLTTQFAVTPSAQWWDIHATIWSLLASGPGVPAASSTWLALAQANYTSISLADYAVVTPTNYSRTGSWQEFLIRNPGVVTPEPPTALLLAPGVLGLGLLFLRRRRGAVEA